MVLGHGYQRVFACGHTRYIYTACLPFSLLLSPADGQSLLRSVGCDTRTCDWQQKQLIAACPVIILIPPQGWSLRNPLPFNDPHHHFFLLPPPNVLVFMGTTHIF